jgi:hypothetical protein
VRRLPTMLAAFAAAGLLALAVVIAAPALGSGAASPDHLPACLRAHGLAGAPSDPVRLKAWLGARLQDDAVPAKRALLVCAPPRPATSGPADAEVSSCLKRHGAQIAGDDPAALKQWVLAHTGDSAGRDAMKACGIALPGSQPAPDSKAPSGCGGGAAGSAPAPQKPDAKQRSGADGE